MSTFFSGRTAALVVASSLLFTACDSNEPDDPGAGEQELITQVVLRFENAADAQDVVTVTATDADGDGAGLAFTDAARLTPGATYSGTIELNDTINNESITAEIGRDAEEHLFFYAADPSGSATITLTDLESQYGANTGADLPVGLQFRVAVAPSASGVGTLNATLFHFDDGAIKSSATATSDERDIDIDFPVRFSAGTL